MAKRKQKTVGAPESIAALGAAMNENQIPERQPGETIETRSEGDKPKKRGRKQPDLPAMEGKGVELEDHPDINEASDEYVAARDRRMRCTEKEVETKAALLAAMKAHSLMVYLYDGKKVQVNPPGEETVKVQTLPDHKVTVD